MLRIYRKRCGTSGRAICGFGTRGVGRLFQFDVTGGRYEEQDYATSGPGSLHAGTVVKLGFQSDLPIDDALSLAVKHWARFG